jgi:hypothetical protein
MMTDYHYNAGYFRRKKGTDLFSQERENKSVPFFFNYMLDYYLTIS